MYGFLIGDKLDGMTNLEKWYRQTIGSDSTRAAAIAAGIPVPTLSRQAPDSLTPESVVKIARAYQVSAIEGLIAQGFLTQSDVEDLAIASELAGATDQQLADEVLRRMQAGGESAQVYQLPLSDVSGRRETVSPEEEYRTAASHDQGGVEEFDD